MAQTLVDPTPLVDPRSFRPGAEIAAATADNKGGFKRVCDGLNSLFAFKQGQLVSDHFPDGANALTTADAHHTGGVHRRWMVKTPIYRSLSNASHRYVSLSADIKKTTAGAGWTWQVYVNGVLTNTINITSGTLNGLTLLSTVIPLDDTLDHQEIRIQCSAFPAWAAANNHCRGVFITPTFNGWSNLPDQSGGYRDGFTHIPASEVGGNSSANVWQLDAAHRMARELFDRRVGMVAACCQRFDVALNPDPITYSLLRVPMPAGSFRIKAWWYVTRLSGDSEVGVRSYGEIFNNKVPSTGWHSVTFTPTERDPMLELLANFIFVWATCIYVEKI